MRAVRRERSTRPCVELFHALLALDHQRLQPWGRYHGLNGAITIEDVALDRTFPADGYEQRMHAWIRSIAGEPPGADRG